MRGAPSFHVCWQVRHWLPQPAQDGRQHPRGAAGPDRGQGGCQQAGRLPAGWAGVLRFWWQPRVPRGARSRLSTGNYRRAYQHAVELAAFTGLDLHGPHDLRSTYATLLEAGSIPARVIDELMGHRAGGRDTSTRPRSARTTGTPPRPCSAWWSRRSRPTCTPPLGPCPKRAPSACSGAGRREGSAA
jgi:Phage integrase family